MFTLYRDIPAGSQSHSGFSAITVSVTMWVLSEVTCCIHTPLAWHLPSLLAPLSPAVCTHHHPGTYPHSSLLCAFPIDWDYLPRLKCGSLTLMLPGPDCAHGVPGVLACRGCGHLMPSGSGRSLGAGCVWNTHPWLQQHHPECPACEGSRYQEAAGGDFRTSSGESPGTGAACSCQHKSLAPNFPENSPQGKAHGPLPRAIANTGSDSSCDSSLACRAGHGGGRAPPAGPTAPLRLRPQTQQFQARGTSISRALAS